MLIELQRRWRCRGCWLLRQPERTVERCVPSETYVPFREEAAVPGHFALQSRTPAPPAAACRPALAAPGGHRIGARHRLGSPLHLHCLVRSTAICSPRCALLYRHRLLRALGRAGRPRPGKQGAAGAPLERLVLPRLHLQAATANLGREVACKWAREQDEALKRCPCPIPSPPPPLRAHTPAAPLHAHAGWWWGARSSRGTAGGPTPASWSRSCGGLVDGVSWARGQP